MGRRSREPMVEGIADGVIHHANRLDAGEPVLGLADEFRLAQEDGEHRAARRHDVVRCDDGSALVAGELGVLLEAAEEHAPEPRFVRAAFGGRDGVAIGAAEAVIRKPGDRPFGRAMSALLVGLPRKNLAADQRLAGEQLAEVIPEPAGKVEARFLRRLALCRDQALRARPADLDAAEEVGLRARHAEETVRVERRLRPEYLRVGMEAGLRAAAIVHVASGLQLRGRLAARKSLPVELSVARDFDFENVGERVHNGDADAVQATGGLVDPGIELSAGMERGHDDLERRLVLEFRMWVDRDAAAVVGDGQETVLVEFHLDPVGVAGDRLVHGIVHHLGEEVMHRLLVGAADIHAGAAADGL